MLNGSDSTIINRPACGLYSIVEPCQNKAGLCHGPSIDKSFKPTQKGLLKDGPDWSGIGCQELLLYVWQQFPLISHMLREK
ncbi:hypothetical protein DPMN_052176 [Dreissena polymorpha]|uniref:Uncharacterized protein n=1 Tax=Dreissena polymorpha TaxID=45954 RepID=A0A9D4CJ76_DREPO|nr:hypothetical protein DPMN_052176 [Dreissena polymorpha]